MNCKIKKIIRYNEIKFDMTISMSLDELETLEAVLELRDGFEMKNYDGFKVILDTINKEVDKA